MHKVYVGSQVCCNIHAKPTKRNVYTAREWEFQGTSALMVSGFGFG